jgi:hypothetical protein
MGLNCSYVEGSSKIKEFFLMNFGLLYKWIKSCDHENYPMTIPKEMEIQFAIVGPLSLMQSKMVQCRKSITYFIDTPNFLHFHLVEFPH